MTGSKGDYLFMSKRLCCEILLFENKKRITFRLQRGKTFLSKANFLFVITVLL